MIDMAAAAGLPTEALVDGLFDATRLRRMGRVDWDVFCVIVERIEALAGGPDALARLAEGHWANAVPELRPIARAAVSPKTLVRFTWDVVDPIVYSAVEVQTEDLGTDRLRVRCWLRPGARPCRAFFAGNVGAIRGMTQHLDLPPIDVDAVIGADHGRYDATLPPSRTLAARAERASRDALEKISARITLGHSSDGTPVIVTMGGDDPGSTSRLELARRAWDLTPRQSAVLAVLVEGRSNKEIADDLQCAESTVELHVTQILRRSNLASRARLIAHFWSRL